MTEVSNIVTNSTAQILNQANPGNVNVAEKNINPTVTTNNQSIPQNNQTASKLIVPQKPTPVEALYIATTAPEAIVKQPIQPVANSTSDIYDQLQKKAESAEILALRGTAYERFYFKTNKIIVDSVLGNYLIGGISTLAIISLILPLITLDEYVKYLFLPSLFLMSICLMLQVALKIKEWINSVFIVTFALQLFIGLFVFIRFIGMLNLELPIINWYISKFYL